MINHEATQQNGGGDGGDDLKKNRNPVLDTNLLSRLLFLWLRKFFRLGLQRPIEESDIYSTLDSHRSAYIGSQFDKLWKRETVRNPHKPSFLKVIVQLYGLRVLGYGLLYTAMDVICRFVVHVLPPLLPSSIVQFPRVIQPLCLGGLVMYFRPGQQDTTEQEAYLYAAAIVVCILVPAISFHPFIMYILQIGMKIRLGCCAILYQKALRISKSMTIDGFDGQVINLMSNDVSKFDYGITYVHDLWKGPLELFILGYFIYREINICGLVGIGFMLLFIPLQGELGSDVP